MWKWIGGGIVLIVIIAAIAGGSSNNSGGGSTNESGTQSGSTTEAPADEARVQLIARRSSCYQLPEVAQVKFYFYLRNRGSVAGTYPKNVTPEWTTIDAHTVFSAKNTVTFPQKIPAHDWRIIHADLPADGTKLIVSCKALIGDKEVPITLRD